MSRFGALRNRLLPAVLTALGVSLIAGGLLTYTGAVQPAPEADASEIIVTASPTPTPTPSVVLPTIPPPGTLEPTASPAPIKTESHRPQSLRLCLYCFKIFIEPRQP